METFGSRVRSRRKEIGLSQVELAKQSGLSQTTISDIERERNDGSGEILAIAKALLCKPEWLKHGGSEKELPALSGASNKTHPGFTLNVEPGPDIRKEMIPVISWGQAGKFCQSPDLFQPGDAEDWLPTHKVYGPHTYALRVNGDSMVLPYPSRDSIFPDDFIYVDPDKQLTNGSRVVAKIGETDEATLKVYKEDAGRRYLVSQNPQYPLIEIDETMRICGVVVGVFRRG